MVILFTKPFKQYDSKKIQQYFLKKFLVYKDK